MAIEEIISDDCYMGWPTFLADRANRQTVYHYVGLKTIICVEERENGRTCIRTRGSITDYSAGLKPVIIRTTRLRS